MSEMFCERSWQRNPESGEMELYRCGKTLGDRNPKNQAEACPGGTVICVECIDTFEQFMEKAYDARAIRQEHGKP